MQAQVRPRRILGGVAWVALGLIVAVVLGGACLGAAYLFSDPEGRIRITEPRDDAVVDAQTVEIRGTSSPDWAGVYRVLAGGGREQVAIDPDGNWSYSATLRPGENEFKFHLDSHYGQSDSVTTFYEPR